MCKSNDTSEKDLIPGFNTTHCEKVHVRAILRLLALPQSLHAKCYTSEKKLFPTNQFTWLLFFQAY